MSLMTAYVPFFVEDFAMSTLSHLKGSYPVDEEYLRAAITEQSTAALESMQMSMENPNSATRFLCECATYALEQDIANPTSREVYDKIKVLPSSHQTDLMEMTYNAAELYQNTLDTTVVGVVAKEANAVAQLIHSQAQERISQTHTGGVIKHFSWGILSDGLWLNKALMKSFEETKVFRPGSDADLEWSRISFEHAQRCAVLPIIDREQQTEAQAAFDLLLSNANENIVNLPLGEDSHTLKDLLFKNNALLYSLDQYEKGLKQPKAMVEAVSDLSSHVQLIAHLKDVATQLGEDVIPNTVIERLDVVEKSATMALVGFEAMRETRFADSLVLYVDAPTEDPVVDVFVNKDVISSFVARGGQEEELVQIGTHLDPRKGSHTPQAGWSESWIVNRKEDILSQVAAAEEDRLNQLRANDAGVIRNLVETNLNKIAMSYNEACNRNQLSREITHQIGRIARGVTQEQGLENFSLATETTKLLCAVIEDPFVTRSVNTFVEYANHEDEDKRKNAKALTVMSGAIEDVLINFSK
jgi:hypothetical protein